LSGRENDRSYKLGSKHGVGNTSKNVLDNTMVEGRKMMAINKLVVELSVRINNIYSLRNCQIEEEIR
jgi:hypothetical protein